MRPLMIGSFVLLAVSVTALGTQYLSDRAVLASSNSSDEDDVDQDEVDEVPLGHETCLDWQDPHDPMRKQGVGTAQDDQILEVAASQAAEAREWIETCRQDAAKASDTLAAMQMRYTKARFEIALERDVDAAATLAEISDRYPSAAWRRAKLILDEDGELEGDSPRFEETLALLVNAHRGQELRGDVALRRMLEKIVPVGQLSLPTLVASIYFDRAAPDSEGVRMAMLSFFDGYYKYCDMWETFVISPADKARVDNAKVELQVGRIKQLFLSLPEWAGNVRQWVDNVGNVTLEQALRDFNSAAATPSQVMFLIDTAAYRDGWRQGETVKCSGKRAEQLLKNLVGEIVRRSPSRMAPASAADMQRMAERPDLLSML
jgi:hypothetical protein